MGSIRQDDTETRFLDVSEKLGAYARRPGYKEPYLNKLHDSIAAAECITIDGTNERVSIEHADGTEVQISLTTLTLLDRILSKYGDRTPLVDASKSQIVSNRNDPPKRAEMLLHFCLPKRDRECMIGDLEEEYRTVILPKYGARVAARWYWWQAVRSVAAASGGRVRVWLSFGGLARAAGWIVEKFGM